MDDAGSTPKWIARAASLGARVGLAFGVVEALSMSLLTWLARPGFSYQPQHVAADLASLAAHAAIGAFAAVALARIARGARERGHGERELVLALDALFVLALAASLLSRWPLGSRTLQALAAGLCAFGFALAAASAIPRIELGALGGPWIVASIAILTPWATQVAIPTERRDLKLAALVVIVAAAVALASRTRARAHARAPSALPLALGVAAAIVASLFCKPRPSTSPAAAPAEGASGPHVVLVVLDTVRADHCSLHGYGRATTPALERFAADALVFERAYSTSAVTLASHASIFTGLHPTEHGAQADELASAGRALAASHATLAQILAARGYDTAAFVANHGFLSPIFGLDRGFALYDARAPTPWLAPTPPWVLRGALRELASAVAPLEWTDRSYRDADAVLDAAIEWLERPRDRPFLLFVNLMDAHAPYLPPAPFDRRFASAPPTLAKRDFYRWRDALHSGERELDLAVRDELIARYDGGIAYLDDRLERLWDALRARSAFDDALIVVTSDHGEAFGEHGQLFHNATVFDEEVRVPLVIRPPHGIAGARVRDVASGIDLLPTVLDAVGVAAPAGLAGRSLLGPPGAEPLARMLENRPVADVRALDPSRLPDQRALVRGEHAWIEAENGWRGLFDLARDPRQRDNLAEREVEVARALADELARLLSSLVRAKPADARSPRDALDALKQLGYAR